MLQRMTPQETKTYIMMWREKNFIDTLHFVTNRWSRMVTPGRRDCGREADWLKSAKLQWQHWRTNRWLTFCGLQCLCALLSSRHMMTPPHAGRSCWDIICFAEVLLAICVTAYLKSRSYQIVAPFSAKTKKRYLNSHQHNTDTGNTCLSNKMPFLPVCRGCSELYRMPVSEYKGSSSDSGSFEYKFPFRSNNNKWQRTSSSPQQSLTASPQPHTPNRAISLGSSVGKTLSAERLERGAVIPRSVSSDGRPLDTKRLDSLSFFFFFFFPHKRNILFLKCYFHVPVNTYSSHMFIPVCKPGCPPAVRAIAWPPPWRWAVPLTIAAHPATCRVPVMPLEALLTGDRSPCLSSKGGGGLFGFF